MKYFIPIGVAIIAFSVLYYLVIRPIQEKKAYEECFSALHDANLIDSPLSTSEKNFRMESCMKSGSAEAIRENTTLLEVQAAEDQMAKEAEEQRRKDENIAAAKARMLSNQEFNGVQLVKLAPFYKEYEWADEIVKGTIKNTNSFKINNIVLRLTFFSNDKNIIGESKCDIPDFIVFPNTTKDFEIQCHFEKGTKKYSGNIFTAEKLR
jgi:hypothetical protein